MGRGRLMQKLLAQQKKQDDNSGSNNNNYNDNNNNRSRPKKIRKIHDTLTSTSTGKYMNRGNAAAYKRPTSSDGVNMVTNKNVGEKGNVLLQMQISKILRMHYIIIIIIIIIIIAVLQM